MDKAVTLCKLCTMWVREQVKSEQHTLMSVFKMNSFKPFQFKHLSAWRRKRSRAHAVRRFVFAHPQTLLRQRTNIDFSFKSCAWTDKFTQKWCHQHAHLGASILANISYVLSERKQLRKTTHVYSISVLDQCIIKETTA